MSKKTFIASGLTALLCCEDCGIAFERTKEYMEHNRRDVMYKWKTHKCDGCVGIRVNIAMKRLPEVMKDLAT